MLRMVQAQIYKDWKLIFFSIYNISNHNLGNKTVILDSEKNQIRNIEVAVTQHCRPMSYAVLLKVGDFFGGYGVLEKIAQAVSDR